MAVSESGKSWVWYRGTYVNSTWHGRSWEANSTLAGKEILRLLWTQIFNTMKTAVFRNVAPCSLVCTDRRFREAYCLDNQDDEYSPNVEKRPHWSSLVRSKVLMATSMKFSLNTLKTEVVSSSETHSVPISLHGAKSAPPPQNSHIHTRRRQN
jgi:hypothetical protein